MKFDFLGIRYNGVRLLYSDFPSGQPKFSVTQRIPQKLASVKKKDTIVCSYHKEKRKHSCGMGCLPKSHLSVAQFDVFFNI